MSPPKTEAKKEKPIAPAGTPEPRAMRLTPEMVMENAQADSAKLEMANRQLGQLQQIATETAGASNALTELKKSDKGEVILVPLGSGIFIEASLANPQTVKTGLSGTVMVERTIGDALEKLAKNSAAIQKDIDTLSRERDRLAANLNTWQAMMNQFQKARNQAPKPQNG
jgi:prefoldin alpha subunit